MQTVKFIGSSPLVTNYSYCCNFLNLTSVYGQSIRWRKPIWLPTAKTKVFRVKQRPNIPEDEFKEIQRLYNNYRTYMRSVRNYLREINEQNKVKFDHAALEKEETEDFERCFAINEEWNKKVALEREARLESEREARRLHILKRKEAKKILEENIKQEVDSRVREIKSISHTFITRNNIDQAIDEALEKTINYNKALNPDGTWLLNESGSPTDAKKEQVKQ